MQPPPLRPSPPAGRLANDGSELDACDDSADGRIHRLQTQPPAGLRPSAPMCLSSFRSTKSRDSRCDCYAYIHKRLGKALRPHIIAPMQDAAEAARGHGDRAERLAAAETELNEHAGTKLVRRLEQLARVFTAWRHFAIDLEILIAAFETQEDIAVELMQNVRESTRPALQLELDKALIAYLASLGALIDHTRTLVRNQPKAVHDEFAERLSKDVFALPQAAFLGKLRNYVLHYVVAPWRFSGTLGDQVTAEVRLDSAALLEFDWNKDSRAFIESSGETIHLSALLRPYREATEKLHSWLLERSWDEGTPLIEASNQLIARRNLILSAGVSDGRDWHERVAHIQENLDRERRGEAQTDYPQTMPDL